MRKKRWVWPSWPYLASGAQRRWQRFKATTIYAAYLVFVWIRTPLQSRRTRRSWERFFSRYFPIGFLPIGLEEYTQQPKLEACIGCSACLWSCQCNQERLATALNTPKRMVLFEGRLAHQSEFISTESIACFKNPSCGVRCPQGVGLHFAADRILNWQRMRGLKTKKGAEAPSLSS